MIKLLISILASKKHPYDDILRKGAYRTWASEEYENVKISPYYGDATITHFRGMDLHVAVKDDNYLLKTTHAFDHYLRWNWDYMLRTNVSTYVDIPKLLEFLRTRPRTWYYAGYKNPTIQNVLSGTMMIFSRNLVELIAHDKNRIGGNPDDVRIGKYLERKGYYISEHIDRQDFPHWELDKMNIDPDYMFYRCKTDHKDGVRNNDPNIRNDHEKMMKIWKSKQL